MNRSVIICCAILLINGCGTLAEQASEARLEQEEILTEGVARCEGMHSAYLRPVELEQCFTEVVNQGLAHTRGKGFTIINEDATLEWRAYAEEAAQQYRNGQLSWQGYQLKRSYAYNKWKSGVGIAAALAETHNQNPLKRLQE